MRYFLFLLCCHQVLANPTHIGEIEVRVEYGEITEKQVDAIVSPHSVPAPHPFTRYIFRQLRPSPGDSKSEVLAGENAKYLLKVAVLDDPERPFQSVQDSVRELLVMASTRDIKTVAIPALQMKGWRDLSDRQLALAIFAGIQIFANEGAPGHLERIDIVIPEHAAHGSYAMGKPSGYV